MGAGDRLSSISNDASSSRLKREECNRTRHDSVFSQWKVLIGPSDWEDYLLGKEGAARYRLHNLPSVSFPGVYELGIASSHTSSGREVNKLDPNTIVVVYLGQADNVRTRLQQYGRSGAHLGHQNADGYSNNSKTVSVLNERGVFGVVLSIGHSIAFRWAPMKSKADALRTESQLLDTFDYAWNKGSNGRRRPSDILKKLEQVSSNTSLFSSIIKKILPFVQKKEGIKIESSQQFANDDSQSFLSQVFKVSRSQPRLVFDRPGADDNYTKICGVTLDDGSVCTIPPVEGRKRCPQHKGRKLSFSTRKYTEVKSQPSYLDSGSHISETFFNPICGIIVGDGSPCQKSPVQGRKRCEGHKGMRIYNTKTKSVAEGTFDYMHNDITCGVVLGDASICRMPPLNGRKRCGEHKGLRVNGIISTKLVAGN